MLEGRYANYVKVGHNAYEFVLDFGQIFRAEQKPVLYQRIVTSPAYAKAFLHTLEESVQQFEAKFGPISEVVDE